MSRQYLRYLRWVAILLFATTVAALLLVGLGRAWRQHEYPYGWSHCCLKGLALSLQQYAQENSGHFPAGGSCPEASLSLLDRGHNGDCAQELCGKTKSVEAARAILQQGKPLGPDTCDWHYVEGLTLADDYRLAIVWDKIGLGHNGAKLPRGGHSVSRLDCMEEVISESEWPQFIEEQQRLMAARTEAAKKGIPALAAKIRLPNGKVVNHYDASYRFELEGKYCHSFSGSGSSLDASVLRWWTLSDNGVFTVALSLNGWTSKPVLIQVWQGKATPNSVVFEMQSEPGSPSPPQSR
jgi:hypothetical protein